jgi:hypothetical protein
MYIQEMFPCDLLATVTVHRPNGQTSSGGGQPVETTTKVDSIPMMVEKLSGAQAKRAFGDQSTAVHRGQADGDADVLVNDLVVVDTGPYAGTILQVDDVRVPGNMLMVLELATTKKTPTT